MSNGRKPETSALRRAGGIAGEVVRQVVTPDWMPGDLADLLSERAWTLWGVRGLLLRRLMTTVEVSITGGVPPMQALHLGAQQMGLQPRRVVPSLSGSE